MVVNFSRAAHSRHRGLIQTLPMFLGTVIFLSLLLSFDASAVITEVPFAINERIMISISEGNINITTSPQAQNVKIAFSEGIEADYSIEKTEGKLEIRSRDQLSRADFGKTGKKKRDIEIVAPPSSALELHLLEGSANISKFSREVLAHVQKGHLTIKECQGANLTLQAQKGDITVIDSQGRMLLDSYAASVSVKGFIGDIELQNFSGETLLEKSKGFISLVLGSGITKVQSSSGSLQFELAKGILNSILFKGRVEGQSGEGAVSVNLAAESDLNLKAQSGRVTVQTALNSGTLLNVSSEEGEIYGPSYLKVSRYGGAKHLRGRLKGDSQKSSVVVRGQEATIIIK
jgi:hypothetical protein